MFSFLKPKIRIDAPIDFSDSIVIESSAEHVYALLDWADPRNAQRERGHRIVKAGDAPDRFHMTMDELPGHVVHATVTDDVPHSSYCFITEIKPPLGRARSFHEQYRLEALSANACRLTLVNRVTFVSRMGADQFGHEQLTVTAACHNALAKLKLQAEQGVDAVTAVAEKLVV